MASIINDPNGRRRIQFVAKDGSRKAIRLGKASRKQAEAYKVKVEQLVTSNVTGSVDDETARWVAGLDEVAYEKLAAVGLVPPRPRLLLGEYLDGYIAGRSDVKINTVTVYGHTRRNLVGFFGDAKPLREITPGDADMWRVYLIEQKLSENTVRRRCGMAKQFFRAAVRRELISSNPFADLKAAVMGNPGRRYFLSRQDAKKVIDACPDAEWRLIVTLSRYGGLRCPSEHLALRWSDIHWDQDRITVRSPKTEHHEGKASRQIPMFPEVRQYLLEVLETSAPDAEHVITRYRYAGQNLRTQFERIIKRAGLEPWPKLFQNLRSTRETELAEEYPLHVVVAWLGNSRAVAQKHYLQVTDDHFKLAAGGAESGAVEAQNEAQQPAAEPRTETQEPTETPEAAEAYASQNKTVPVDAILCEKGEMGDTGLEPVTSRV